MASPSPTSMTPAFSPGPQMTWGAVVGRVFSQTFDDLEEQCSLHIAETMPSSVRFGVRPRIAIARSNSSALSPCSAANSGVTFEPALTADLYPMRAARTPRVLRDAPRLRRDAPQDEEKAGAALKDWPHPVRERSEQSKDARLSVHDADVTAARR